MQELKRQFSEVKSSTLLPLLEFDNLLNSRIAILMCPSLPGNLDVTALSALPWTAVFDLTATDALFSSMVDSKTKSLRVSKRPVQRYKIQDPIQSTTLSSTSWFWLFENHKNNPPNLRDFQRQNSMKDLDGQIDVLCGTCVGAVVLFVFWTGDLEMIIEHLCSKLLEKLDERLIIVVIVDSQRSSEKIKQFQHEFSARLIAIPYVDLLQHLALKPVPLNPNHNQTTSPEAVSSSNHNQNQSKPKKKK